MSSVVSTKQPGGSLQGKPAPALWSPGLPELIAGVLLLMAVAGLFLDWFWRQHLWSYDKPSDWGHAYILPLIAGWYFWKNRVRFSRVMPAPFGPGYPVVLLGIVMYIYFSIAVPTHMFQGFGLIIVLAGLVLLLLGPVIFRMSVLPLAFLSLGMTAPERVMETITWRLKLLASQGAWALLNMIGVSTDIDGNVLTITDSSGNTFPLNVAEACSGMRMVVAFVALAAAVAIFACDEWWKRFAVLLLAVPVALLMNVVRVAVLGIASMYNPELAAGEAHMFIGTILLVPALGLFMGGVWAMNHLFRSGEVIKPAKAASKGAKA
ncbi:MAG TPA: exosortase/archaeosortase family protein [Phycisphaerales bacterium]|nr:exosortase/archaeosortase family protein [Phycisphaerales bacterium]